MMGTARRTDTEVKAKSSIGSHSIVVTKKNVEVKLCAQIGKLFGVGALVFFFALGTWHFDVGKVLLILLRVVVDGKVV